MKYGRYQILNELGRGTMGFVYLAKDPKIDRNVALNVFRPVRLTSEDLSYRFLKEAKAIGRLSHPNIVTVYDIGKDHDTIFITMELLEGESLDKYASSRKMTQRDIINIGVQIAKALDYAHKQGIVHRDVKPTNIIVSPDFKVKLTDFGIALIEDSSATQQTQVGKILGTPAYMSSEQVAGNKVDGRTDLYALGVILYELSTGKRPFSGDTLVAVFNAITNDSPLPPGQINSSVSKAMSDLIMKGISKNPNDRFQSGQEMDAALKACLSEDSAETIAKETLRLEIPKGDLRKNKRSVKFGFYAFIVLILISLIAGLVFVNKHLETQDNKRQLSVHETLPDSMHEPVLSEKKHSRLNVTSEPVGAMLFINGQFKGKTPVMLDFEFGKYEVRLSLKNYYDWKAQIDLKEETEMPLFVKLVSAE